MSEERAEAVMQNPGGVPANVVHYDADLFNAAMLTQVAQNPISNQPMVACIAVGGMSRRLGIAMNLFPAFLKDCEGDSEQAMEGAFEAAEMLIAEDRRRQRQERVEAELNGKA